MNQKKIDHPTHHEQMFIVSTQSLPVKSRMAPMITGEAASPSTCVTTTDMAIAIGLYANGTLLQQCTHSTMPHKRHCSTDSSVRSYHMSAEFVGEMQQNRQNSATASSRNANTEDFSPSTKAKHAAGRPY